MTEADTKQQQTLRMDEQQAAYVATAQRVHNELMATAQNLVNQGNAKGQDAQTILRHAVEGVFTKAGQQIPTAEVRIVNDERGRPAVLVWTDPAEKPEDGAAAADASDDATASDVEPAAAAAPAPVAPAPAPVAPAPAPVTSSVAPAAPEVRSVAPTNGKVPHEAVKRKLPVK